MIVYCVHNSSLPNIARNGNMICSAMLCHADDMTDELDSSGQRLRWARERAGFLDAAQFARAVRMKPVTYRAYELDQNGFAKYANQFARRLGVTGEWLLEGGPIPDTEPPEPPAVAEFGTPEILTDKFGIELVRKVDISYAMGDGAIIEDYPETGFFPFSREFLRMFSRSPVDKIFLASGHGDSMEPTIRRDELVLVDAGQSRVTLQDQIWALTWAGAGMIKRLRRLPGDRYLIMSDNQSVPDQEAEADDVHVVGRVVWAARGL